MNLPLCCTHPHFPKKEMSSVKSSYFRQGKTTTDRQTERQLFWYQSLTRSIPAPHMSFLTVSRCHAIWHHRIMEKKNFLSLELLRFPEHSLLKNAATNVVLDGRVLWSENLAPPLLNFRRDKFGKTNFEGPTAEEALRGGGGWMLTAVSAVWPAEGASFSRENGWSRRKNSN